MTDEEVSKLIDEVDENKDGKLDYKEVRRVNGCVWEWSVVVIPQHCIIIIC